MNINQYQQWFEQRAQRNQPVQISQNREWIFEIKAVDQYGEPCAYMVRLSGNSYGHMFTQALRRFYQNFPGSRVQSATGIDA